MMEKRRVPTVKPIAVYHKILIAVLSRSFLPIALYWLIAFLLSIYITKSPVIPVLIFIGGIAGTAFVIWNTRHSKIEYYADAVVIATPMQTDTVFLDDIDDLLLEFNTSRNRRASLFNNDLPRVGYTTYSLKHHNGLTAHFSDEYQDYEKVVERLKEQIHQVDGALPRMINMLNEGGKITFFQFTATKEGIMAENGEYRAWSQLRLLPAEYPRKQRLAERDKRPATSKLIIWVHLPTHRSMVFDGLLEHFIAPY